jgi:hypothetical protein
MNKATEDLIRERAHHCCEYCRMPQEYDDLPFQFDHIIAKTHGGPDDPPNRALACVPCNLYKGPNLSGVDSQTGKVVRLFDPRRQNWNRHFRCERSHSRRQNTFWPHHGSDPPDQHADSRYPSPISHRYRRIPSERYLRLLLAVDLGCSFRQHVPPVPESEQTPAAEVPLTRKEKEQILQKMYSLPHWIEVIRLFGYQAMHLDKARTKIKPLADEYGKEPMAKACEVLVEIFTEGKEPFARLKSHVRRMAFQILGPEPTLAAPTVTPAPEPQTETEPSRRPEKRRSRKSAAISAPPPAAVKTDPASSNNRSAIMQQYHAAKEKHPDMLLLFRNVAK